MLSESCGFYVNTSAKEESLWVLKRNIKLIDDLKAQVRGERKLAIQLAVLNLQFTLDLDMPLNGSQFRCSF